jgi:hypothetical protein
MRKYDADEHGCSSFITVISGFIYWICMIVIISTIKTVWGRIIAVIAGIMSIISVLGMSVFSTEEVLKEVEENREE